MFVNTARCIVIVGPTASGKSDCAIFLARQIKKHKWGGYMGAEIVSADSRQVYTHLDVGTNKVPGVWQAGRFIYKNIPHHCIDFVHPKNIYTAADYAHCAKKSAAAIVERGMVPIFAGGTGFYIQAAVDGIGIPRVPPNPKRRRRLEKKSAAELFAMLQKLDPNRAAGIDAKNPRRLLRAIEIVSETGKPVPPLSIPHGSTTLFIGITKPKEELHAAIEKRTKKQIPGLLREIELLRALKISKRRIRELGFEYSLALGYKETSPIHARTRHAAIKKLAEGIARENRRYTKRQMTWFQRDKRIHWVRTTKEALDLTATYLQ